MADENTPTNSNPPVVNAPTEAAASAPVVAQTPVSDPAASSQTNNSTPAPVTSLDKAPVEPAKAPEQAVSTEKPVEKAPDKSLLGGEVKKTEDKAPDPQPAPVEQPKEEVTQSAEPAPLPTYEAFTLPEGISLDDKSLGEFTKTLGEFQTESKAEQALVQKLGQKLVDRHVAEVTSAINRLEQHYVSTWEKQKSDWKEAFASDPEIGGNRQQTTLNAAIEFIRTHGGTDVQQKEFRDLMDATGIGNHPAVIRMLANANLAMAEGKPLPAAKPVPQKLSKVQKFYGGNG